EIPRVPNHQALIDPASVDENALTIRLLPAPDPDRPEIPLAYQTDDPVWVRITSFPGQEYGARLTARGSMAQLPLDTELQARDVVYRPSPAGGETVEWDPTVLPPGMETWPSDVPKPLVLADLFTYEYRLADGRWSLPGTVVIVLSDRDPFEMSFFRPESEEPD